MESSLNRPDDPWKRGAAWHNRRWGCSRVVSHRLPRSVAAQEEREAQSGVRGRCGWWHREFSWQDAGCLPALGRGKADPRGPSGSESRWPVGPPSHPDGLAPAEGCSQGRPLPQALSSGGGYQALPCLAAVGWEGSTRSQSESSPDWLVQPRSRERPGLATAPPSTAGPAQSAGCVGWTCTQRACRAPLDSGGHVSRHFGGNYRSLTDREVRTVHSPET